MAKKDRDIKEWFEKAGDEVKIDAGKKEDALVFLRQAIADKDISLIHSRKQMIRNLFWYMDKTMWGLQLCVSVVTAVLVGRLYRLNVEKEQMVAAAMVLSGLMGVLSVLTFCHALYSEGAELGESCYFNASQMLLFRLVYSGVLNLAFLMAGILFVGSKWKIPFLQIGLYVLVPFLLTQSCSMAAAFTEAGRKNPYLPGLAGVFSALFCWFLSFFPELYFTSALSFWGIAFGIGVFLFGLQIRRLFCEIEKGEILCMN